MAEYDFFWGLFKPETQEKWTKKAKEIVQSSLKWNCCWVPVAKTAFSFQFIKDNLS